MPKIFIVGSCVTRDILDLAPEKNLELVDYFARSSFASLAGGVHDDAVSLEKLSSPFQRRVLSRDHDKSLLSAISKAEFDIIAVDFIDERFKLLKTQTGGIATLSNEYEGCRTSFDGEVIIDSGAQEKQELWIKGWNTFVQVLRETGKLNKLVVNEVYWDVEYPLERPGIDFINKMNRELDWYYQKVAGSLKNVTWLSHQKSHLAADLNHRWKPAPYHYVPSYYENSMKDLVNMAGDFKPQGSKRSLLRSLFSRAARQV